MDFKNIKVFPEFIEDVILYVLLAVVMCFVSKAVFDWKEKRRLAKEFAAHQQMKQDE